MHLPCLQQAQHKQLRLMQSSKVSLRCSRLGIPQGEGECFTLMSPLKIPEALKGVLVQSMNMLYGFEYFLPLAKFENGHGTS